MYKYLIRPILFICNPETIHGLVVFLLKLGYKLPGFKHLMAKSFDVNNNNLSKEVFGLKFRNPVGLAAGFDKDALLVDELALFGFGFIEIGTVTPRPQPGNDKPRLFRLKNDKGLINRMGFNNSGVAIAAKRLKERKSDVIIGGNIGKNKMTPNELAYQDYELCFDALYDVVDYFVINVSSPNTPNLRELQEKEPLKKLLKKVKDKNREKPKEKPILLKIAPDLNEKQLDDIVEIILETKIDGVVATNTTISREGLLASEEKLTKIGQGGLSGKPVKEKSTEVVRYLYQKSRGLFPIIAVGGIFNAKDAQEKLDAGASLVQIYTGFIYEGPAIVKNICKELSKG